MIADLEEEIAEAPAHTVAGVAVKIRLLQENHEQGWDAYYADCVRTALEALERLAGGRVISAQDDPVVAQWQRRQEAWDLVFSLDGKQGSAPFNCAFEAAGKIDMEIANLTATSIEGVLHQADILTTWSASTGHQDARMAIIGHFILEGLKFVVRDDCQERDLAGAAVKE